jgi:2,3-diaminopropionate biosynthesis protein SbnA
MWGETMINDLLKISQMIGKTPTVQLENSKISLFAKLEFHNLMNTVKARSAYYILKSAVERGEVTNRSTIIESSSGNFAISLAVLCKRLGIRFIPVIDPNINCTYENILNLISNKVVKITDRDKKGGYLLSRLQMVEQLCQEIPYSYWTNQYENQDNFLAHYNGIGQELVDHFQELDYAFVGVGTGGTIAGISLRLKEKFPNIKIVAVDIEGSVIFGGKPKKRFIPGLGSSIVPPILKNAIIDEILHVNEINSVEGCYRLLEEHAIFAGGSSGSVYYAIQKYFDNREFIRKPNVVFLCPDSGVPYTNTVYSKKWVKWLRSRASMVIQK